MLPTRTPLLHFGVAVSARRTLHCRNGQGRPKIAEYRLFNRDPSWPHLTRSVVPARDQFEGALRAGEAFGSSAPVLSAEYQPKCCILFSYLSPRYLMLKADNNRRWTIAGALCAAVFAMVVLSASANARDGGGGGGGSGSGGDGGSGSGSSGSGGSSGGSGSGSSGGSGSGGSGSGGSGSGGRGSGRGHSGGHSQSEIVDRAQSHTAGDVVGLRRDGADYAVKIIDKNGRLVRLRVNGRTGEIVGVEGR